MFKRAKQERAILNFIKGRTAFYEHHKLGNKKVYRLSIECDVVEGDLSKAFIDFLTKWK